MACQSEPLSQRLKQAHAPTYIVTPYLSSSPVITHRQRSCIICIAMHTNEKGIRLCRLTEQRNEGIKTRVTKFEDCIDCLKPEDLFQLRGTKLADCIDCLRRCANGSARGFVPTAWYIVLKTQITSLSSWLRF